MRTVIRLLALGFTLAFTPAEARRTSRLTVERVVIVMRHGVRPPTKAQPLPASAAPERWPEWPVAPGWLTPHGAMAVRALARADRAWLVATRILPSRGCPVAGSVIVNADSDQRTIATGDEWARAIAPGCSINNAHHPEGEDDPAYSPIGKVIALDAPAADRAVAAAAGPGGLAAVERAQSALLHRLDTILCGEAASSCGVSAVPSTVSAATPEKRPKLSGALDLASTAAQSLLLEYADGKPVAEVGWGRATPGDLAALSAFHALEFRLVTRPAPLARASLALLIPQVADALEGDGAGKVTMYAAHDTQVAGFAGLLDLHWRVAGFAADDPAPGGALVFERVRDGGGRRFVRVSYRAQTLDGLRRGDAFPVRKLLTVPGCAGREPCPVRVFMALLRGAR